MQTTEASAETPPADLTNKCQHYFYSMDLGQRYPEYILYKWLLTTMEPIRQILALHRPYLLRIKRLTR
jgi:hypothetical protein